MVLTEFKPGFYTVMPRDTRIIGSFCFKQPLEPNKENIEEVREIGDLCTMHHVVCPKSEDSLYLFQEVVMLIAVPSAVYSNVWTLTKQLMRRVQQRSGEYFKLSSYILAVTTAIERQP